MAQGDFNRSGLSGLLFGLLLLCAISTSGCGLTGYGAAHEDLRVPVYHRVKSGDTVAQLSRRYGVSTGSILRLNQLVEGESLSDGSTILVGYRMASSNKPTRAQHEKVGTARLQKANFKGSSSSSMSSKGFLLWPVESGRVVSGFGPRNSGFHDGLDIAAPEGTPVYAAHGGLVVYSGDKLSGYGKLILLRQDNGLTSVYAHNSSLLVDEGERVKKGQQIAKVGSTGHATGPHLHFEVRTRDKRGRYVAVDPLPLLNDGETARPRWRINESLTPILAKLFN